MRGIFLLVFVGINLNLSAQVIPTGFPIWEEVIRRNQILNEDSASISSFLLRPGLIITKDYGFGQEISTPVESLELGLLPLVTTARVTSKRPYGWGDYGMIPNPGLQTYFSGGIQAKYKFINFTFRPELVIAQNKGFETDLENMRLNDIRSRFFLWNFGDFPERYGESWVMYPWWGQSKLTFQYGSFEIGGSTQNIWWGPGQWNALTFSNNAQGFPHLTLNTTKPAKTFLGNFETQLIVGRLENSGVPPSQVSDLNDRFFRPFTGDWRYLNAITLSWNPKWIKGFYFGFSRTFQQYNTNRGREFSDWFPIFDPFQKERFFSDGNSVEFDANGRDQTVTIFGRLVLPQTKSEVYFEYGRRDHAFNWKDFVLNPEHARAFLFGYKQLFELPNGNQLIQIRSEITHQQESVNRYIRNNGIEGGLSWHTHTRARGFVNYGQPLGVGIGTGSNVQTVEVSLVEGVNKMGLLFERLANNQDFYYKALFQFTERRPWIDYSLGFLYDKQFNNLLLSSKLQLIHARNYQWQLHPSSTPEFPRGQNLTSVMAQVSAIYFWKKK